MRWDYSFAWNEQSLLVRLVSHDADSVDILNSLSRVFGVTTNAIAACGPVYHEIDVVRNRVKADWLVAIPWGTLGHSRPKAGDLLGGLVLEETGPICLQFDAGRDEIYGAPRRQAFAEILETKVICAEKDRYIGWPTVLRRQNGELIAVFSGDRDRHVCPWGKVEMVRSTDDGRTWSNPIVIRNGVLDDRDAGIMETADGVLVCVFFSSWSACTPETLKWFSDYGFREAVQWGRHFEKIPESMRMRDCGYFSMRSLDGGKTWETPVRMASSSNHGGIALKDGRLLMVGRVLPTRGAFYPPRKDAKHRLLVEESTDAGRSWRILTEIVPPQTQDVTKLHEPHVVEVEPGHLVALFRNHQLKPGEVDNVNYHLSQCESRDGGSTWSELRDLPIRGFPPHVLRLRDGRLLLSYCKRGGDGQFGEFARISNDGGQTWDAAGEVFLSASDWLDLGYPSTAELSDGTFLTVYYQPPQTERQTALMSTRWRLLGGQKRKAVLK